MMKILEMKATVYLKSDGGRNVFFAVKGEDGRVAYLSASPNQDGDPSQVVMDAVTELNKAADRKAAALSKK